MSDSKSQRSPKDIVAAIFGVLDYFQSITNTMVEMVPFDAKLQEKLKVMSRSVGDVVSYIKERNEGQGG